MLYGQAHAQQIIQKPENLLQPAEFRSHGGLYRSSPLQTQAANEDSNVVRVRLAGKLLSIPKNYIEYISDDPRPTGLPFISMTASYPGLVPLPDNTKPFSNDTPNCLAMASARRTIDCFRIDFRPVSGWTPNDVVFSRLDHGQPRIRFIGYLPNGLKMYHEGSETAEAAGIDIYYGNTGENSLLFVCTVFDIQTPHQGACDSTVKSQGGLAIRFRFNEIHINEGPEIANGLKNLFLGPVDGFNQDQAAGESNYCAEACCRFLAA